MTAIARPVERDDAVPDHVSAWIVRLRTLRAEGKPEDAALEHGRFRAAFSDADARLPPDLEAWAATIGRRVATY